MRLRCAVEAGAFSALSAISSDGSVHLMWSVHRHGYTLESTTNLHPPALWSVVSEPVYSSDGLYQVRVTKTAGQQFFRLRREY